MVDDQLVAQTALANILAARSDVEHFDSATDAIEALEKLATDSYEIKAEGNYVSLQRESDSYLLRESISRVAEKLKPFGFIRIHRSALVNTTFVVKIKAYSTGKCGLRVKGGKEYAVTSEYKKNLNPSQIGSVTVRSSRNNLLLEPTWT
jgi:DNA-binding LytR/AlgR family response regulator